MVPRWRLFSDFLGPAFPASRAQHVSDLPSLAHIIRTTRLKFFGHIARADPSMDHSRALRTSVDPLPGDWNHLAPDR